MATDRPGAFKFVSNKEHGSAVFDLAEFFERGNFFIGEELGDRAFHFAVEPTDVAEAFGTDGLSKGDHAVEKFTGFIRAAGNRDRLHNAAVFNDTGKGRETAVAEDVGCILHDERVAQIRFIGAVFVHRFEIRDADEWCRIDLLVTELGKDSRQNAFVNFEDVILGGESHFHIELIELAGRTVGTGVFVAEAGSNLEVAVEPGGHEQLFKLLRSLRQRVEFAGVHAARNEIIACAFRRGTGEDRSLHFHEPLGGHQLADAGDHLRAQDQVFVKAGTAQVEEAVLQAQGLITLLLFIDLKRNHLGFAKHFHGFGNQLDFAGGKPGINCRVVAGDDFAGEADDGFNTPVLDVFVKRFIRIDDDLGNAVVIAQVDKKDAAMVADGVDPSGQTNGLPNIFFTEFTAGIGSVLMHDKIS